MENLNKRPSKGILRFSEGSSRSNSVEKDIKWDEANIKDTLHPDDKDYGFMKIDEPPTPYSRSPHGNSGENSDDDEATESKTKDLLERVSRRIKEPPVVIENLDSLLDETDLDAIEKQNLSISEQELNGANIASTSQSSCSMNDSMMNSRASGSSISDFELKRKRHYNEFHAVKLAKKLMQKELDDADKDDTTTKDVMLEGDDNIGGDLEEMNDATTKSD